MTPKPQVLPLLCSAVVVACTTDTSIGGGAGAGPKDAGPPGGTTDQDAASVGGSNGNTDIGGEVPVCGDGRRGVVEGCDDGNVTAGDGCSETCLAEPGYICTFGGVPCTPRCGDGKKVGVEECDDGNSVSRDGCTSTCRLEPGWDCSVVGQPCISICGDGILADAVCDDGNRYDLDGCSSACTPEPGFLCDVPGARCRIAPDCRSGICASVCGDGLVVSEECDDGNLDSGDGCSASCTVESGWVCDTVTMAPPDRLAIPVTFRDFVAYPRNGSAQHPDQRNFSGGGVTPGMVENLLDVNGLPVYTGVCEEDGSNVGNPDLCPHGPQTSSRSAFDQWYRDVDGVNLRIPGVIELVREAQTSTYTFDGGSHFTPATDRGWDALDKESQYNRLNYGFTTELRYFFEYRGGEQLTFAGDDDVWVFVNRHLAVDLGGMHPRVEKAMTLDEGQGAALELNVGSVYELVLLHAERAPSGSNFHLTLAGFNSSRSQCTQP